MADDEMGLASAGENVSGQSNTPISRPARALLYVQVIRKLGADAINVASGAAQQSSSPKSQRYDPCKFYENPDTLQDELPRPSALDSPRRTKRFSSESLPVRKETRIERFILHVLTENIAWALALLLGLTFKDRTDLSVFPLTLVDILCIICVTSGTPDMGAFDLEFLIDMVVCGVWVAALCLVGIGRLAKQILVLGYRLGFFSLLPIVYIQGLNTVVFKHGGITWEWVIVIITLVLFFGGVECCRMLEVGEESLPPKMECSQTNANDYEGAVRPRYIVAVLVSEAQCKLAVQANRVIRAKWDDIQQIRTPTVLWEGFQTHDHWVGSKDAESIPPNSNETIVPTAVDSALCNAGLPPYCSKFRSFKQSNKVRTYLYVGTKEGAGIDSIGGTPQHGWGYIGTTTYLSLPTTEDLGNQGDSWYGYYYSNITAI
ncbi:hypothetical protein CHU98_g1108 [Xylaria longipes]|nr:hypothetical protein CHU98_g1108 [Xylaria longipes]